MAISENVEQIRLPLVNNYIKIIRNLASYGRNYYQKYLIQPLSSWSKSEVESSIPILESLINEAESKNNYKVLPELYKKIIVKSVAPDQFDMSLPGNLSLNFLKEIKENSDIALSDEARQFVSVLYKPFKDFSDYQFRQMNKKFRNEIDKVDDKKVKELAEINSAAKSDLEKYRKRAEISLKNIENSIPKLTEKEVKKQIMNFLLQFANPKDPGLHKIIYPLIQSVGRMHQGYMKDILANLAVLIYYEVVNSIKVNDLKRTLLFISKYIVLFRGDPSIPKYNEIDSFEKNFFELIDSRNLWDII